MNADELKKLDELHAEIADLSAENLALMNEIEAQTEELVSAKAQLYLAMSDRTYIVAA